MKKGAGGVREAMKLECRKTGRGSRETRSHAGAREVQYEKNEKCPWLQCLHAHTNEIKEMHASLYRASHRAHIKCAHEYVPGHSAQRMSICDFRKYSNEARKIFHSAHC